jgi:hypothetical protein
MMSVEQWFLRVADSDWTWVGLNWLRPPKDKRLGFGYIVVSSVALGLPDIVAGVTLIALVAGRIDLTVCLWLLLVASTLELLLNLLFAYYWNRRAKSLGSNHGSDPSVAAVMNDLPKRKR